VGRRKSTVLTEVSDSRLKKLEVMLRSVRHDLGLAREAGSWSAVAALHRQIQSLQGEADAEELRRAAAADVAPASDASDLTPEEWAARCVEDARASSDLDLDHYMAEWCRRHKLRLVVRAGEPVLVRDGLSLVSGGG
jgi:hypothetical protein